MFLESIPMVLCALVLFTGTSVLLLSPQKNQANRVLAALLFASAFSHAVMALDYKNLLAPFENMMLVMHIVRMVVAFLFGPLILIYTRLLTGNQKHLQKQDAVRILWAPALVALAVTPFVVGTIWFDFLDEAGHLSTGTISHLSALVVFAALLAIMPFTYFYVFASWRLLVAYLNTLKDAFSYIEDKSLSWLRWFLVGYSILATMAAIEIFDDVAKIDLVTPDKMDIPESFILFVMNLLVINHVVRTREQQEGMPPLADVTSKYERSALGTEQAARIAQLLDQTMRRESLYRDPFLSLGTLAARARVKPHRISQVLNVHIGRSFFDYVNGWRIHEAKRRLADEDLPIVKVFEDVGFNSRSTFYTAFKKETGLTPSEYRKRLRADDVIGTDEVAAPQRYS